MKGLSFVLMTIVIIGASTSMVLQSYAQTDGEQPSYDANNIENQEISLMLDIPQTVNSFGVPMDSISVNHMVQISANIDNLSYEDQNFVFQIKIKDADENVVKEQWISGMISAQKRVNSSISWIPEKEGTYTVIVSVGNDIQSLNNQKTINVDVAGNTPLESCKEGLELIFKTTDGSPACVKPTTAEKLIERGWATRT